LSDSQLLELNPSNGGISLNPSDLLILQRARDLPEFIGSKSELYFDPIRAVLSSDGSLRSACEMNTQNFLTSSNVKWNSAFIDVNIPKQDRPK
jgi:hypothetical protein